jgi:hypothetical protein
MATVVHPSALSIETVVMSHQSRCALVPLLTVCVCVCVCVCACACVCVCNVTAAELQIKAAGEQ